MKFSNWLDIFLYEKGIQLDEIITVEGPSGPNYMEVSHIVAAIKSAPVNEQNAIKATLVKIDFANANVMHFFLHLARAIAI